VPSARPAAPPAAHVLAVFVGGAAGTAVRAMVGAVAPTIGRVPVSTIAINVVGAFALGALLALLARRGPDAGRRRTVRLLLGTGVLGGFTTFSSLAVDTAVLLDGGRPAEALAYGLGSVLAGVLAATLGAGVGRRR
jgi:fluoride exporter